MSKEENEEKDIDSVLGTKKRRREILDLAMKIALEDGGKISNSITKLCEEGQFDIAAALAGCIFSAYTIKPELIQNIEVVVESEESTGKALGIDKKREKEILQLAAKFALKKDEMYKRIKQLCDEGNFDVKSVLAGVYFSECAYELSGLSGFSISIIVVAPKRSTVAA